MGCKITVFYRTVGTRVYGWSESFYSTATSFTAANSVVDGLLGVLNSVHGLESVFIAVRVSILDARGYPTRASRIYENTNASDENSWAPSLPQWNTDFPFTALLLRATTVSTSRQTRQWIKGIPDNIVGTSGRYVPSGAPGFADRLGALTSFLGNSNNTIGCRVLDPAHPAVNIVGVNFVTSQITTGAAHGMTTAGPVRITKAKGRDSHLANSTWSGSPVDATHIELLGFNALAQAEVNFLGAQARPLIYTIEPASWIMSRISSHQVGAPFGRVIGRRRTRR